MSKKETFLILSHHLQKRTIFRWSFFIDKSKRTKQIHGIFMVITNVFKGTSKARLEARYAKIALRHWRKCLKHKKLAPSRRKHLRRMPRYAFDASDNEAYTFIWISIPHLFPSPFLLFDDFFSCGVDFSFPSPISPLVAWIFFFSFGGVNISLPPHFPSLSLAWISLPISVSTDFSLQLEFLLPHPIFGIIR